MSVPASYTPGLLIAASIGLIAGYTRATGIGFNPDVDPGSVPEDCWGGSGLFPWMGSLTSLEVVSDNAADGPAGVGALTVSFSTLVGDYVQQSQVVTLNGTTPVPVPVQAIANNGGLVLTAGSSGTNIGTITLRDAGGGTVRGIILPGKGTMRQAPYTVPAGRTLIVPQLMLAVNSPAGSVGKFAFMETWFKSPGSAAAFQPLPIGNTNGQPYAHHADPPIMVPERRRFSLRITEVSDNNTIITAAWNGLLRVN